MSQFPPQPPPPNPFGDYPPPPPGPHQNPYQPYPYQPSPYGPQFPPPGHDPALGFLIPVGQSVWALLSGYLGLLSLIICFLGPFAIITGIVGLMDIRKNPQRGGTVRCIIGIGLGLLTSLGMVLGIISLVMDAARH